MIRAGGRMEVLYVLSRTKQMPDDGGGGSSSAATQSD